MVASEAASSQGQKTTTVLKEYGRYSKGKGELWKISDQAHRFAFEFANTNNTGASGNSKAVGEYRDNNDNKESNVQEYAANTTNNNNTRTEGKPLKVGAGLPSDKSDRFTKPKLQAAVSSSALKRISAERSKNALKDPVIKGVSCNDAVEPNGGLLGIGTGKVGTTDPRRKSHGGGGGGGVDDVDVFWGAEERTIMSHVGKPATQKNATVCRPQCPIFYSYPILC